MYAGEGIRSTDRLRRGAWMAAGLLLGALGFAAPVAGLAGVVLFGGGVVLVAVGVPPLVAAAAVLGRRPWARPLALFVAVAYAIVVAVIATTPLRGLAPAPGEPPAAPAPGGVLVTVAFLAAAALLAFGDPTPGPRGGWRRRTAGAVLALLVFALGLAAAGLWIAGPGAASPSAAERSRAEAVLRRWSDAVSAGGGADAIVIVGDRTRQVGNWELDVGDNNKRALMAGLVEAAIALPTDVPPDAEVRWADGTSETVPLVSAAKAADAIRSGPAASCVDCVPLEIVSARLIVADVVTGPGPASVPAWEFGLQGTAVTLTRVAGADSRVVVQPAAPAGGPRTIAVERATISSDGRALTVEFVGSPDPGSQACGADYTATAVESSVAVVVVVAAHPFPIPAPCSAVGAWRSATAPLATPLGTRSVLDPATGQPIDMTRPAGDGNDDLAGIAARITGAPLRLMVAQP